MFPSDLFAESYQFCATLISVLRYIPISSNHTYSYLCFANAMLISVSRYNSYQFNTTHIPSSVFLSSYQFYTSPDPIRSTLGSYQFYIMYLSVLHYSCSGQFYNTHVPICSTIGSYQFYTMFLSDLQCVPISFKLCSYQFYPTHVAVSSTLHFFL